MINDTPERYLQLDVENLYAMIQGLPGQLTRAWKAGLEYALPKAREYRGIVFSGMGASAACADLLAAAVETVCPTPLWVLRGYDLPQWVQGEDILFVALSFSGETEETISAFQQAVERGCTLTAIGQGGTLAEMAREARAPFWQVGEAGRARNLVGWGFGLGLALLHRLGLVPNAEADLRQAVEEMETAQAHFAREKLPAENPAKRMAGQMMGRFNCFFAAEFLEPAARRWKTQVNETAKAWAQMESIPEADHNTLEGVRQPEELLGQTMMVFFQSDLYREENRSRVAITRRMLMLEGLGTDMINARGSSRLAQMWTTVLYGDYVAYYLAIFNGVDPSPVELIRELKEQL